MSRIFVVFMFLSVFVYTGAQPLSDTLSSILNLAVVPDSAFNKGNMYNTLFAIKGHVSGLTISENGGNSQALPSVLIRGASLVGIDNQPLYVIDGVIGADPQTVSAENIKSVAVLKNIYQTARYGIRGGNGVIEITTKSGQSSRKLNIEYHSMLSIDQTARRMDLLNADQYRELTQQWADEHNLSVDSTFLGNASTDWQDEVFQTAVTHEQQLSIYGSVNDTRYRAFVHYRHQPGILIFSENETVGAGVSLEQSAFDNRLLLGMKSHFKQSTYEGLHADDDRSVLYNTYRQNPTDPVYNTDGSYHEVRRAYDYFNPVHRLATLEDETLRRNYINSLFSTYHIADYLSLSASAGHTFTDVDREVFLPSIIFPFFDKQESFFHQQEYLTFDAHLAFDKTISENHCVTAMVGYNFTKSDFESGSVLKYSNDYVDIQGVYSRERAYTTRLGYDFKNRYFVHGTLRNDFQQFDYHEEFLEDNFTLNFGDGIVVSTLPADYDEGHSYWSYGSRLGWNLHEEPFLKNHEYLDFLQVSIGYGRNYSQNQDYSSERLFHLVSESPKLPRTSEWSTNVNFSLFNNKIWGDIGYYKRETTSHFLFRSQPIYSGDVTEDLTVENMGWEFDLGSTLVKVPDFEWVSSIHIDVNRNEVKKIDRDWITAFLPSYNVISDEIVVLSAGESLYSFYLPQTISIIDGEMVYLDDEGDATTYYSRAKKEHLGTIFPQWQLGWQNQFRLMHNLDFSFSLRYVHGHSIYNNSRASMSYLEIPNFNIIQSEANSELMTYSIGDMYLEDASYLRLDNLTIGYNIDLSQWIKHGKVRIYAGGNNLLTLTKFKGLDPELNYFGNNVGIENPDAYPPIRSFVFGVKLFL